MELCSIYSLIRRIFVPDINQKLKIWLFQPQFLQDRRKFLEKKIKGVTA